MKNSLRFQQNIFPGSSCLSVFSPQPHLRPFDYNTQHLLTLLQHLQLHTLRTQTHMHTDSPGIFLFSSTYSSSTQYPVVVIISLAAPTASVLFGRSSYHLSD